MKETGQHYAEYALLVAFVAILMFAAATLLGDVAAYFDTLAQVFASLAG